MPKGALRWRLRNRIAMVREARGMTQQQLASLLGIARSTVAKWESDESRPSDAMVGRLAQVLRCQPGKLFPYDFV
jgi:transcriptional regulator with XRE-family HTH domain